MDINTPTGAELIGEFIAVPTWRTEGMVIASRPATMGTDAAIEVLAEVKPDDPQPRWFRLEPTEYELL